MSEEKMLILAGASVFLAIIAGISYYEIRSPSAAEMTEACSKSCGGRMSLYVGSAPPICHCLEK